MQAVIEMEVLWRVKCELCHLYTAALDMNFSLSSRPRVLASLTTIPSSNNCALEASVQDSHIFRLETAEVPMNQLLFHPRLLQIAGRVQGNIKLDGINNTITNIMITTFRANREG